MMTYRCCLFTYNLFDFIFTSCNFLDMYHVWIAIYAHVVHHRWLDFAMPISKAYAQVSDAVCYVRRVLEFCLAPGYVVS